MQISKSFEFDAAHRLHRRPDGHPCRNLHGHRYKITVNILSPFTPESGMIVDYNHLKMIKSWIDENVDHSVLVAETDKELIDTCKRLGTKLYQFPINETTSEYMAEYFKRKFASFFTANPQWFSGMKGIDFYLTLQETPNTSATTECSNIVLSK